MFLVFGANGFLNFIPTGPMPTGLAGQFLGALMGSHLMLAICVIELIAGLLFLSNRCVPVALSLTGPIIVNILLFHAFMNPSGIVPGLIVTVLWLLVFYSVRSAFAGIFQCRAESASKGTSPS
jgi:putative oxidoreductase